MNLNLTTVALSLPEGQLRLLERIAMQQERLLAAHNGSIWLSEDEAAERVKVSVSTIRKWRTDGWLQYHKIDKVVLFRASEFDDDVANRNKVNGKAVEMVRLIKSRA
jgi:excisionase family DNA binding protein